MDNQEFTYGTTNELNSVVPSNAVLTNVAPQLNQQQAADYDDVRDIDFSEYLNNPLYVQNPDEDADGDYEMDDLPASMEQELEQILAQDTNNNGDQQAGQPGPAYVNLQQIQQTQPVYTNNGNATGQVSGNSGYAPQHAQQDQQGFDDFLNAAPPQEIGPGYVYQYDILKKFEDPAVPLQVIDRTIVSPFPEFLEVALQKEFNRQEKLEVARILREKRRKGFTGDKTANSNKVEKNKRAANIKKQIQMAAKAYKILPRTPQAWGSINPDTKEETFQYTSYGELIPGTQYTVPQMLEYLAYNPQHPQSLDDLGNIFYDTKRSPFKLWIQNTPADSAERYPVKGESNKCRFEDCSISTGTISKGEIRVCFDENRGGPGFPANPFHNAGYVHLFCLEKHLDFPDVCKHFDVIPDTREFPAETKKFAITRDHASLGKIAKDFIRHSMSWQELGPHRPVNWYEQSLCYKLTKEHLTLQQKATGNVRVVRGGVNIGVHQGNLDKYVDGRKKRKVDDLENPQPKRTRAKRGVKRSASVVQEEDSDDEDILELKEEVSSPLSSVASSSSEDAFESNPRPIKRARISKPEPTPAPVAKPKRTLPWKK